MLNLDNWNSTHSSKLNQNGRHGSLWGCRFDSPPGEIFLLIQSNVWEVWRNQLENARRMRCFRNFSTVKETLKFHLNWRGGELLGLQVRSPQTGEIFSNRIKLATTPIDSHRNCRRLRRVQKNFVSKNEWKLSVETSQTATARLWPKR